MNLLQVTISEEMTFILKGAAGVALALIVYYEKGYRKDIKVFSGPSLSQVFDTVRGDVLPQAGTEFQAQLIDAMRYILVKKYPPEPIE